MKLLTRIENLEVVSKKYFKNIGYEYAGFGEEVVAEINKHHKDVKTLVLSMHDSEEYVVKSIQAGADGYLLKGASKEEFLKALNKVASGGKYFTGDVSSIIMNNFVNGNITKTARLQKETKELPFK